MLEPSIAVLADDLTGAAEIAGIGKRHGLLTRLVGANGKNARSFRGLSVFDSDSRLLAADQAASRCTTIADAFTHDKPSLIYKKTDSVLRGNVLAECIALARSLGRRRILLVPANPSLGRTIVKGQYFINGVPLDATAFGRDPHHPAKSNRVVDLLGASSDWPVSAASPHDTLPEHGLIVGDAASTADVALWASRLDAHTLPAGGAEFFQFCLRQNNYAPQPTPPLQFSGPVLIVTGAITPARETLLTHAATARWPVSTLTQNSSEISSVLSSAAIALVQTPKITLDDHATAERLRTQFGELVRTLLLTLPLGHIVVEGGSTAAAISDANGWTSFDLVGEWAPGVIALHPVQAPFLLFTIKPGSYAWPEELWSQLDHCHRVRSAKN